MDAHVRDAMVTGFEHLIPTVELPDPDDRHVVAASVLAAAHVILTANLKDFPDSVLSPHGLVAEHPDAFLARLCSQSPARFLETLHRVRARLRNPPLSHEEHLSTGRVGLNTTTEEILARTASPPPRPRRPD